MVQELVGMGAFYYTLEPDIYRNIAQEFQHVAPILDVGCGDGRLVNFLAVKLGKRVFGVDISDSRFEKAKKEAELKDISHLVEYVKTEAGHLDMFRNRFFGGIVSVYTLHEFDEPLAALREMRRVLKTGGKSVIVDFIKGGEAEKLWGERYYTPAEIRSMFEDAGFREARTSFLYEDVVLISSKKG